MSIAVLNQVYDETRRLSIAGSTLASGDFRIKKLIAPLEKSAAKAPVFGQVAKLIEKLIDSPTKESAQALLDLSSLVSAILYTQGQTAIAGQLKEIKTSEIGQQTTQVSARIMKPLIEALTNTGSGRLEIVKESFERGAFQDLRIIDLAVKALDDVYPELADFVADNILPRYGQAIQPLIENDIDIKGRAGNVRRLRALHQLDPKAAREVVLDAFENGSKEMKIAALGCLGASKEDLPHLHEQAKAKAKDVRRVAFERLSTFTDAETISLYTAALTSTDVDLVVGPISQNKSPKLLKLVHEAVEATVSELLEGKAKTKLGKPLGRLATLLFALRGRTDKRTGELLQELFDQRDDLLKLKGTPTSGSDVVDRLSDVMLNTSYAKLHRSLIDARDEFGESIFTNSFIAGITVLKPAEAFKLFSPYYAGKSKARGKEKERRDCIRNVLFHGCGYGSWAYYYRYQYGLASSEALAENALTNAKLDPKWLAAAVTEEDFDGVYALAKPGDKAVHGYLQKYFDTLRSKSSHYYEYNRVLEIMIRTQDPKATEYWISAVQHLSKKKNLYTLYYVTRLLEDLPASAVSEIEKILPGLPDKAVDEIMERLTALKSKTRNTQARNTRSK